jgi:hypothetical protein
VGRPGSSAQKKSRRHNHRHVKIHRNYTVEDTARLFGVHKNTIRLWIKLGLPIINDRRPFLIPGLDLANFLQARRGTRKQPCAPGFIYCVKCRAPKTPALKMADYVPITATGGNLRGICPECETLIHRRVSLVKLDQVRGELEITLPQAERHIRESRAPSLNCDSGSRG